MANITVDMSPTIDISVIANNVIVSIPKNVILSPLTISNTIFTPTFIGGRYGVTIQPYTTRVSALVNYLPTPINNVCIIATTTLSFILDEFLDTNVTVFVKTIPILSTVFSFALWELDRKPRVIRMGNVDIKPSMYFTSNRTKLSTSSKLYIHGKAKIFSQPLYKFTSSEIISTDSDFWLDAETVQNLYSLLDIEFNIYLSNGEIILGKFDVSSNPFSATRIYTGGTGFYLTLKVLI